MEYILSLGSNIGDRYQFIKKGVKFLAGLGTIVTGSSIYETSAVGMGDHADKFLNSVLILGSDIKPDDMLQAIKLFEQDTGRDSGNSHMLPRKIDIDILFADDLIINTSTLTIPHMEIMNRKFILEPLNEIIPDYEHPVSGKTIKKILKDLISDEKVNLYKLQDPEKI